MELSPKQLIIALVILTLVIAGLYLFFDPERRLQIFSFGTAYFITGSLIENHRKRKEV